MQSPRETRQTTQHPWWMLGLCLLPLAGIVAIAIFNVPVSSVLLFGVLLLCPLMHLVMMRGHGHGTSDHAAHHQADPPRRDAAGS